MGRNVVVITGCVGTGKTTVSEIVAKQIGASHLDLSKIALEKSFLKGYDRERDTPIADIRPLRKYVKLESERVALVVLDGHYASHVAPVRRTLAVIVLRCHPSQLKRRLLKKGYGGRKVEENLLSEMVDVCLCEALSRFDADRVHEIDSTVRSPKQVAEDIILLLEGKKRFKAGKIDWLSSLEREGRLQRVLEEKWSV